jgi:hypothetical protein
VNGSGMGREEEKMGNGGGLKKPESGENLKIYFLSSVEK